MEVTYFGEEITDDMKVEIEEYLKRTYGEGDFEVYSKEYVETMNGVILANGEFQEEIECDGVAVEIWK